MVTYTDHECRIAICMFLVVSQCWKERDNNETVALMSQAAPLRVPGWFIDAPYLFTWLWVTTREPWFFPGKVNGMDDLQEVNLQQATINPYQSEAASYHSC